MSHPGRLPITVSTWTGFEPVRREHMCLFLFQVSLRREESTDELLGQLLPQEILVSGSGRAPGEWI